MSLTAVILGAGAGTRMQSDMPKVLHRVAGRTLLDHAIASALDAGADRLIVVAGHGADQVRASLADSHPDAEVVLQAEQKGTAHAVDQARELAATAGDVLVLYGDTPFITARTVAAMQAKRAEGAAVVVLGFEAAVPGRYGRLITGADGSLDRIVEAKDATADELAVSLCNSGVLCAPGQLLFHLIARVGNTNASGEYYLTDVVGLARADGLACAVVTCPEAETMGVNSRADLAAAEAAFQARARADALEAGVTLAAPETVYFSADTVIGRDVVIEPNVVFGPDVTVESGATIRAFSHLEGAHVSAGAVVGPYARLRPGAEIGNDARVGNFVEVKAATIGEGAKVNHLSYIGDADVGDRANIGAGTVTCNYDGVFKHRTEIGADAFIGSDTMLVAPVRVGAAAMVGSGSVITRDVPDGALAVARAGQENLDGRGRKLMDRLRARKAAKQRNGE